MYRVKYNRCIQGCFRRRQLYELNAWYIYIYITVGNNDLEKDATKEDLYLRAFLSNYVFALGHTVGTAEQACPWVIRN
jgi:hypothetical protein